MIRKKPIRKIRVDGDVAYIRLTQGYEAIIDSADINLVDGVNWYAVVEKNPNGDIRTVYAVRMSETLDGLRKIIRMHRVIAGTPDGMETDHEDGDGLNNRRANLRKATRAQNGRNARTPTHNTSGVKGVHWSKRNKKWRAEIMSMGKGIILGLFNSIEDAEAAYAEASKKLHGDFGRTA